MCHTLPGSDLDPHPVVCDTDSPSGKGFHKIAVPEVLMADVSRDQDVGGESPPDLNQTLNIGMSDGRIEPFKGTFEKQAVHARFRQHLDRPVRQVGLGVEHISHPCSVGVFEKIPEGLAGALIPVIVLPQMVRFERSHPAGVEGDCPVCLDGNELDEGAATAFRWIFIHWIHLADPAGQHIGGEVDRHGFGLTKAVFGDSVDQIFQPKGMVFMPMGNEDGREFFLVEAGAIPGHLELRRHIQEYAKP